MRKLIKNEFFSGMILSIIIISMSFIIPFTILFFANKISPYLAITIQIFFCFQILASKSLQKESMKVHAQLTKNDIENARKYLSYIVGRDTQELDEKKIIKACVETVAENTTDGVVAPLIFMAIGGAPLAFTYKAINTLDSMIGYKNEKYYYFGKFAARLDDVANFIPARISAIIMIISTLFTGLNFKNAIKIYVRDRKNHKSPNSAQTESVCAGAIGIMLAGNSSYFGKIVEKPTIGDANREVQIDDIKVANKLMVMTSIITTTLILLVLTIIFIHS